MPQLGKRLTCPLCRDSSFMSFEMIEAGGGKIYCTNHTNWIEMVDLAELIEILGISVITVEEDEVCEEITATTSMFVPWQLEEVSF